MDNKFQKMLEQASDLAEEQEFEEAVILYDKILKKYILNEEPITKNTEELFKRILKKIEHIIMI